MGDKEVCSAVKTVDGDFLSYHLYFWEGVVIVAVNVILFYVIISNSKLRTQKEYLLYAGCIFFDIIFGLTYAIAAVYRFFLAWNNTYFPLFTIYQCILTPHIILFVYITPGAGILVLVCSIDRFFGVFFPIKYIKMTTNYAYSKKPPLVIILFSVTFTIPLLMLVAGIVTSSRANTIHNQQATCTTAQGTTADMYMILRLTRVVGSCTCAIVYIPIFARIYLNIRVMSRAQVSSNSTKKLLRTTTTVVLITLNTILLFTTPDIILLINPKTTSNFFYILNLNKGVVNLIIFFTTQHTLREAVFSFIKCKKYQVRQKASISRGSIMHVRTITVKSTKTRWKSISKKKSGFIQAEEKQRRFTFKLS